MTAPSPFAVLLREYRLAAGLSQEGLAERAGLSAKAVGALERGDRRAPYRDTVDRLAAALALAPEQRDRLDATISRRRGPAAQPPARPHGRPRPTPGNLPAPSTSFIGRGEERTAVTRLLDGARLLTLAGAAGVGKTRLATEIAAGVAGDYADGVRMVELAPLADPALVPGAVATALGVREEKDKPLTETLAGSLREKELLLLLDNCEHLRDAAAALARSLLGACPRLRILATSRAALGVVGETVWRVPPLSLPEPAPPPGGGLPRHTAASVLRSEAAQLLGERATAAYPAFALDDEAAPAVAAICARLDGLPLAIELAAARARILAPAQIAAHLDERFRLLSGGTADAPSRQQTLRAALDWSHDLLTAPERALLHRLSVFAGGCDIQAVEAVCVDATVTRDALFDLLAGLVAQSLVAVEYRGDAARYRMLESVREYAAERLDAAGEGDAIRRRHRDWALAAAESARLHLEGPEQAIWLERLATEHDNMRAALDGSLRADDATAALRLSTALQMLWRVRGHFEEGMGWFGRALACPGDPPPRVRANALGAAANLAYTAGDVDAVATLAQEKIAIFRGMGETRGVASALVQVGGAALERRKLADARAAYEESAALYLELGDQKGVANAQIGLGSVASDEGDHARAAELYERALATERAIGDRQQMPTTLRLLGGTMLELGDYARALTCAEEGLTLCRESGELWAGAGMLRLFGHVAVAEGDLTRAIALHEQSLTEHREAGNAWSIAEGLYYLARTLLRAGDAASAQPLLDESLALCRAIPYPHFVPSVLRSAGDAARLCGDLEQATAALLQSLDESRTPGDRSAVAPTLETLAATEAARGQPERAARLLGAAGSLRDAARTPRRPHADPPLDDLIARLRTCLGDTMYDLAWAEGAAMTLEQALAYART